MKVKFYAASILCLSFIISSCKKQEGDLSGTENSSKNKASVSAYTPDNTPKVVAYFPSYRDPAGVPASNYSRVTHLFYAFITPDTNGNLNALPNPSRFSSVIASARAQRCKVGIAVAGAANLAIVAANPTKRTTLVNNLVNFVVSNNLDGLDMDWEFPRTSDGSSVSFAALMNQLSTALHAQNKFLSAAITPGVYSGSVRDGVLTEVFGYADFFNIMIYDGLGWDSAQPNQHASYNMAVASLDYWITTRGMPAHKAIVGLPSYGLSNTNSTSVSYRDLIAAGASSTSDYFTYDGSQYGYNGIPTIVAKTNLAKLRGNGVMLWEMYGDTNSSSTSILHNARTTLGIGPNTGIFDDFTSGVGRYTRQPTYSGTTVGVATTSTASQFISGSSSWLRVILNDNTSVTTPWVVRLLSGDGLAANNVSTSKNGKLYFWLKTTGASAGSTVKIYIDDSDGTISSAAISVISDNAWHKYSWDLSTFSGTPIAGGNTILDAANVTLDAIILTSPNRSTAWTSYIDDVGN